MWTGDGRAHIEVKTAQRPGAEPLHDRVREALERLDGVDWAVVDGVAGRVIVAFDGDDVGVEALVDVVEAAEELHGVGDERFSHDRVEQPGDGETIRRVAIALAADAVGTGFALAGSVLRATPIPVEVGAIAGFIEDQPRLRRELEAHVGPWATDVGLAVLNAAGAALAQGPLALAVDAVQRGLTLRSAEAHRRLFHQREPELYAGPDHVPTTPVPHTPRPVPLPEGPLETYARRASLTSLVGSGMVLATTRSWRRASAALLAGLHKPARLGRDAFCAELGHHLARRGVLVVGRDALPRLDRVDCMVLGADVVTTGRRRVAEVHARADVDHDEVNRQVRDLFRPGHPRQVRARGAWTLGPIDKLALGAARLTDLADGPVELGLCRGDELVAVLSTAPEIAPEAHQIVEEARHVGAMVALAGGDLDLTTRLHADLLLDVGHGVAEAVRDLQRDGCVVLLIDDADHEALRAADVGVGVLHARRAPWGADLLVPDLPAARFVVEAAGIAHEVSRQGDAIALGGSSIASVLALSSPDQDAGRRAATAVNTAALVSMANGVRAAASLARHPEPVLRAPTRWHEMSRKRVLAELDSRPDGLTPEEAARRRRPAARPLPAPLAMARAMWLELANPMTPVMAGSAALSAAVGSPTDAGVVMSVILVGGAISGIQRYASESAVRSLVAAGDVHAHVRRDGELVLVPADELVPGDVVEVVAGDTVPADCRLLRASALEVDEASLTGESEPVTKATAATFRALVAERTCMLYAGTSVVAGSATAVVVAVGHDTEAAAEVDDTDLPETGVEARMRELATVSLPVAGVSGAVLAASQLLRGLPVAAAVSSGISLAVAAVPEGLPMLATVGQLAVARRLARHNVLVRDPRAVEALGRIDVVCIDKTGTLTVGKIELSCVWDGVVELGRGDLQVLLAENGDDDGDRAGNDDEHGDDGNDDDGNGDGIHAGRILAVARRASPAPGGDRSLPHFTDRAVLDGAHRLGVGTDHAGDAWARLAELPFGADRPMHATWGQAGDDLLLSVKGAPEHLLPRSTRWATSRGERPLDDEAARRLADGVDRLARRGLRVLAVAERRFPRDHEAPDAPDQADVDGLTLLGFVGLADPVRPTAKEAIDGLRDAGVDVVMVTGDHPSTAAGVAAELGILDGGDIISGTDLAELSDAELDRLLDRVTVFARVTPSEKVRIVKAYRRAGRAVGMTGDGANDANAIRLADAGIAVGSHCAPAARTAADVIITDSRIETILEAIVEGRALWAAVRDSLAILLGGNLGEIGFILASGGLTGRPSLSTRQVLLVNLLTDILPSMAIVASPPPAESRRDLAHEGPERSLGDQLQVAIVRRAEATALGATSAWLLARAMGAGPRRASTIGLASVVGTQLGQTLLIGGRDPLVTAAAIGSAAALAAVIEVPGLSQFFGCTPLGPVGWSIAVGTSVGASLAAEHLPDLVQQATPAVGWLGAHVSQSRELLEAILRGDDASPGPPPAGVRPITAGG